MTESEILWSVMGAGVIAYALTGGADFGGGIWHLLSRGPNRTREREAIERAIAPIWEANHVWLIFVIVLLFTAFPSAFAVISTALHIPLSLALVGIVVRGSAFVFHAYGFGGQRRTRAWALAFGVSSLFTPLTLGVVLAALCSGEIQWNGARVTSSLTSGWTSSFALLTGCFAAALFALLAATYLAAESEADVAESFRGRALLMELVCGGLALAVLLLAKDHAPLVYTALWASSGALGIHLSTAAMAAATAALLFARRYRVARVTVAAQVALVVIGWGLSMRGSLVVPDVTLANAGTRTIVATVLLPVIGIGAVLLAPSLWYLFRVFKGDAR